jgi:hypothetical protein
VHVGRDDGGVIEVLNANPAAACSRLVLNGMVSHHTALLLPALKSMSVSNVCLDQSELTEAQLMLWCE